MTEQIRLEKFSSKPIEEKLAAMEKMNLDELQALKTRLELDLKSLYDRWGTKAAQNEDAVDQMVIEDDLGWVKSKILKANSANTQKTTRKAA